MSAKPTTSDLHASLLKAHARDDRAALVGLYEAAADASDGPAEGFFLTHAYVYALETADERAEALKMRLVEIGAEVS